MIDNDSVAIILATYNGERYLCEQLDSLFNQTYQNFVIFVRDDDSTDSTIDIINSYILKYPSKIKLVKTTDSCHSSKGNFLECLKYVSQNFSFYMFCDQDDIWHKDKIEISVDAIKSNEFLELPLLVHTDLNIVDGDMNLIEKSFYRFTHIDPLTKSPKLYVQNHVVGCTMLWNAKLNKMVLDFLPNNYENIIMHDWWFALIAYHFGKIIYCSKQTINYRQHSSNVCGCANYFSIRKMIYKLISIQKEKLIYLQLKLFLKLYRKNISSDVKKYLYILSNINSYCFCYRLLFVLKTSTLKHGFMRKVQQCLAMFFL